MRKLLLLISVLFLAFNAIDAQVVFSKFKLGKDEPMGMYPGRKMLDTKFKVTSERPLKYVFVDWYAVNAVGDVVSGVVSGVKSDNEEFIKPKGFQCTGPFESGKSYSRYAGNIITVPKGHNVTAFPYMIEIMYMGENEMIKIPITKENIKQFFPKIEWMEINRYNPAL